MPIQQNKPIPDVESRLRTKFPALFNLKVRWETIKNIAKEEGEDKAEDMARAILRNSKMLMVRNKIAVRHRILRKDYFRFQIGMEDGMKASFNKLSDKISQMILNAADDSGTIPLHKSKSIFNRLKDMNTDTFRDLNTTISGGVRGAIRFGLTVSMDSAQDGLALNKSLQEEFSQHIDGSDYYVSIEADKKAVIAKTSTVFKTIFDRVKKRRIKQGIFKNRFRNFFQVGHSLSQSVWDLRNENLRRLRNIVSSGIASGRSAISMASQIKKMTKVGLSTATLPPVGRGIAKSAYKNALRLARTETNNAYHEAELEYARTKGYKKKWNLSAGHSITDICDELAQGGKNNDGIYAPENVPSLPHPACACYLTTIIPGIS